METAEAPLISILMAIYEPQMDWLEEQLKSLNAQTYPNVMLFIRDDCSPTVSFEEITKLVHKCITAFPFQIERAECNTGSNGAFEALTRQAEGEYYAYCDQDDIWLPEKLDTLCSMLRSNERAGLACSDVSIIDSEGKLQHNSIRQLRPRHVFLEGERLYPILLYHNFVIGTAMLIRSSVAKDALPFAMNMVHDHYLAFCCSVGHEILFCEKPLVLYRQHGGNQTGVLAGVSSRQKYKEKYVYAFSERVRELSARYALPELRTATAWAEAREQNAVGKLSGIRNLWRLRETDLSISLFELTVLHLPEAGFLKAVHMIRQRR